MQVFLDRNTWLHNALLRQVNANVYSIVQTWCTPGQHEDSWWKFLYKTSLCRPNETLQKTGHFSHLLHLSIFTTQEQDITSITVSIYHWIENVSMTRHGDSDERSEQRFLNAPARRILGAGSCPSRPRTSRRGSLALVHSLCSSCGDTGSASAAPIAQITSLP